MHRYLTFLPVILMLTGCPPTDEEVPECISDMITQIESEPLTNPPANIYQYEYNGQIVYFRPQRQADIFSELYNEDCQLICHPDGGITGQGDGKCSDFMDARTNEQLVWKDPRTND